MIILLLIDILVLLMCGYYCWDASRKTFKAQTPEKAYEFFKEFMVSVFVSTITFWLTVAAFVIFFTH